VLEFRKPNKQLINNINFMFWVILGGKIHTFKFQFMNGVVVLRDVFYIMFKVLSKTERKKPNILYAIQCSRTRASIYFTPDNKKTIFEAISHIIYDFWMLPVALALQETEDRITTSTVSLIRLNAHKGEKSFKFIMYKKGELPGLPMLHQKLH